MKNLKFILLFLFCINILYANDVNFNDTAISNKEIDLSFENLYKNSHIVVKSVIWILFTFSIFSWAIFVYKIMTYKRFFKILKNDANVLRQYEFSNLHFSNESIIVNFLNETKDELHKSKTNYQSLNFRIEQRLKLKTNALILSTKKSISFLASVSSSAPFIGLFGTVWGIMHSFIDIAKTDNASLSVVAPGIAEALFATALGLVVAIPAVLFYNYLSKLSISFSNELNQNVMQLYLLYDREFIKKDD